jgi:hypothetical protein
MIQSEFQRFLQTLLSSPSYAPVHKFANLVLKSLDEIVPLSTHQGQRVKHVAMALNQIRLWGQALKILLAC